MDREVCERDHLWDTREEDPHPNRRPTERPTCVPDCHMECLPRWLRRCSTIQTSDDTSSHSTIGIRHSCHLIRWEDPQDLAQRNLPTAHHRLQGEHRKHQDIPWEDSPGSRTSCGPNVAWTHSLQELPSRRTRRNYHQENLHCHRIREQYRKTRQVRQDPCPQPWWPHPCPTRTERLGPSVHDDDPWLLGRNSMGVDPHPDLQPRIHWHIHRKIHPTHPQEPTAPCQCQRSLGHVLMDHRHADAQQHDLQTGYRGDPPRPSHHRRHPFTTSSQEAQEREGQGQEGQGQGQDQEQVHYVEHQSQIPAIPIPTIQPSVLPTNGTIGHSTLPLWPTTPPPTFVNPQAKGHHKGDKNKGGHKSKTFSKSQK